MGRPRRTDGPRRQVPGGDQRSFPAQGAAGAPDPRGPRGARRAEHHRARGDHRRAAGPVHRDLRYPRGGPRRRGQAQGQAVLHVLRAVRRRSGRSAAADLLLQRRAGIQLGVAAHGLLRPQAGPHRRRRHPQAPRPVRGSPPVDPRCHRSGVRRSDGHWLLPPRHRQGGGVLRRRRRRGERRRVRPPVRDPPRPVGQPQVPRGGRATAPPAPWRWPRGYRSATDCTSTA